MKAFRIHWSKPYPLWLADRIAEIRRENDRPKAGSFVEYQPTEPPHWWLRVRDRLRDRLAQDYLGYR